MTKYEDSARGVALRDISIYLRKIGIKPGNAKQEDIWYVFPYQFNNKETRRLNAELGIHKVNKFGGKMKHYRCR
jgi:hypothetical protein